MMIDVKILLEVVVIILAAMVGALLTFILTILRSNNSNLAALNQWKIDHEKEHSVKLE